MITFIQGALTLILLGMLLFALRSSRLLPSAFLAVCVASVASLLALTTPAVATFLPAFALHGTLLLALTAVLTWFCAASSAGMRHFLWTLGVAGTLLVPLLVVIAPRWPAPPPVQSAVSVVAKPVDENAVILQQSKAGQAPTLSVGKPEADNAGPVVIPLSYLPLTQLFALLWVFGAVYLFTVMLIRRRHVLLLINAATPVTDPAWLNALAQAEATLGVHGQVRLLTSDEITVPCAAGVRRPTVLVPVNAHDWTDERRMLVLLHEMAHIHRHDCLTQWLAEIACALCWFNPLAWWAAVGMRKEREQACDDRVLATGAPASTYAAHLLDIARYITRPQPLPGLVAMASSARLEHRLRTLLAARLARYPVTLGVGAIIVAFIIAFFFGIAGMHAESAPPEPGVLEGMPKQVPSYPATAVATLADGTQIRLIGISDNPRDQTRWWTPTGAALPNLPDYAQNEYNSSTPQLHDTDRWLLLMLDHYQTTPHNRSLPISLRYRTGDGYFHYMGYSGVASDKRTLVDASLTLPPDEDTRSARVTLRVGVASGPWIPIVRIPADARGSKAAGLLPANGGPIDVTLTLFPAKPGRYIKLQMLTLNPHDYRVNGVALRLVGVRKDGEVDTNISFQQSSGNSLKKYENYTYIDSQTDVRQFREFRYEMSRYTWVEFHGIPLFPKR